MSDPSVFLSMLHRHFKLKCLFGARPLLNTDTCGTCSQIITGVDVSVLVMRHIYTFCRYGSVLLEKELASFKSIMKSFMVLIVTALAMGETLALAPDLLKGNQMVSSIFDMIDRKSGIIHDVGEELMTVEGMIELKRINFIYPSRPNVVIFKDFNLIVPSGKSLALVGHSGSGKSSIISLILRFYDPTSGKVMIDGNLFQHFMLISFSYSIIST